VIGILGDSIPRELFKCFRGLGFWFIRSDSFKKIFPKSLTKYVEQNLFKRKILTNVKDNFCNKMVNVCSRSFEVLAKVFSAANPSDSTQVLLKFMILFYGETSHYPFEYTCSHNFKIWFDVLKLCLICISGMWEVSGCHGKFIISRILLHCLHKATYIDTFCNLNKR
jgi:hypothetical protein